MSPVASLLLILGSLLVGAMSPGPSFLVVSRTAIAGSRREGLAAALGMGAGGTVLALLAAAGLQAVLRRIPALHLAATVAGGAYLLWLAVRLWRRAGVPLAAGREGPGDGLARRGSARRAFLLGLGTQLSNPKTALVYAGIFAALLPAAAPGWMVSVLPVLVFAVEAGWYALVALALSAPGPRAAYARRKAALDRAAAAVLGALGVRLIAGA
jgi:threonine/homoserine/homoserine lactone efflux protein